MKKLFVKFLKYITISLEEEKEAINPPKVRDIPPSIIEEEVPQ